MKGRIFAFVFGFCFVKTLFASDVLIMTAPPEESEAHGEQQYKITADYISSVLGKTVRYEHPGNWMRYQRYVRNDHYDIVFDGPHMAAWRMEHIGHDMLVRLPGNLQYYLLTAADNEKINSPDDLISKKVCGIAPPDLSTMSILAHFRNPAQQPVIRAINGSMVDVYQSFLNGDCSAFVVRRMFYNKRLKEEERQGLKVISKTEELPNQVITTSKRINSVEREKLQKALLSDIGTMAIQPTLTRFLDNANAFVPASNEQYKGYNRLLEGVIFGW